jgi:HSP20 family molecular chaperone IbpA
METQAQRGCEIDKSTLLNHLVVSPADIHEYIRSGLDLIARRAHTIFESRGGAHGHDLEDWFNAEAEIVQPVAFEMEDSGDAFIAVVSVDNYLPADLRVSAEPQCLRICGVSGAENEKLGASEDWHRNAAQFFILVNLPAEIVTSDISADIRNGTLEVRLPKKPIARGF